jgi:hypothetical protein
MIKHKAVFRALSAGGTAATENHTMNPVLRHVLRLSKARVRDARDFAARDIPYPAK